MASSMLLGSSMEAMWSLISTCQLLFFLGLVSVYYPKNILKFFTYLGMANVDNVFLTMLTQAAIVGNNHDNRQPINYRYNEMGYQKISILENISDLVALALLMILGTIFVVFMSLFKKLKTVKFLGPLLLKLQKMFMFNAIFRLLLEGCCDLLLSALIELNYTYTTGIISHPTLYYLCWCIVLVMTYFLVFSFWLTFHYYQRIKGKKQEREKLEWCSAYFTDFQTKSLHHVMFYPYFLLRRILFVTSLIFFINFPKDQIMMLIM